MGQCLSGRNEPDRLPGPGPEEWPAGIRYQPYHDRSEVSTLQSKIDVLQSELAQVKANAKKTRESKDADIKLLSDKIAQLKADAQKAHQEKEWAEGTLNESQRQLAESKARLKSLNDDYDALKTQAQLLQRANDELRLDSRENQVQVLSASFPLRQELLEAWKTWIESSGADEFAVENASDVSKLRNLLDDAEAQALDLIHEQKAALLGVLGMDKAASSSGSLAWIGQALRDSYSMWSKSIDASGVEQRFGNLLEGKDAVKSLVKILIALQLSNPELQLTLQDKHQRQYDSTQHQQLEFLDIPAQPEGKAFVEALPGICEAEGANELLFSPRYVFLEE